MSPRLKRPIVLNAFSRGGSSLVWNVLQSHPNIVSPGVETHQVFLGERFGGITRRSVAYDLRHGAVSIAPKVEHGYRYANAGVWNPSNMTRRALPPRMAKAADAALAEATREVSLRGKYAERRPGERYTEETFAGTRAALKNINGIVWLAPELAKLYPDATFLALIRNGLALCEARERRESFDDIGKFGAVYAQTTAEMMRQADELPNYHVLRFEDLLADPEAFTARLFEIVGEDPAEVDDVRFKMKAHYDADGNYIEPENLGGLSWLPRTGLRAYLKPDSEAAQIERLSGGARDAFLAAAAPAMQSLGYR